MRKIANPNKREKVRCQQLKNNKKFKVLKIERIKIRNSEQRREDRRLKVLSNIHSLISCYIPCFYDLPNPLNPKTLRTSLVNLKLSNIGSKSSRHSSFGSFIHPSIGIPFAI